MSGFNRGASVWMARAVGACLVVGMCMFAAGRIVAQTAEPAPWVVPDDAKKVKIVLVDHCVSRISNLQGAIRTTVSDTP